MRVVALEVLRLNLRLFLGLLELVSVGSRGGSEGLRGDKGTRPTLTPLMLVMLVMMSVIHVGRPHLLLALVSIVVLLPILLTLAHLLPHTHRHPLHPHPDPLTLTLVPGEGALVVWHLVEASMGHVSPHELPPRFTTCPVLPPPPCIVPQEPRSAAPLGAVKLLEGVEATTLLAEPLGNTLLEHSRGLGRFRVRREKSVGGVSRDVELIYLEVFVAQLETLVVLAEQSEVGATVDNVAKVATDPFSHLGYFLGPLGVVGGPGPPLSSECEKVRG